MDKIKIIHCADLHFDTPFKEFKGMLAEKSKEEIKEVFSKIIDLFIEEKAQILLLAGDIFDNLSVSKTTLKFIGDELKRIGDKKVFISPGNHDPINSKSFYNLVEWPSNVKIFKGETECCVLEDLNVRVFGRGFEDKHVKTPLLEKGNRSNKYIDIMVIHGEVTGGNSSYNPISLEAIRESGMDYIALGHKHAFSGILKEGSTFYAYSGCPQGRGFDELGEKGVIIGEVSKGIVDLKFKPLAVRNYEEREVNISGCYGYDEIVRKVLSSVDSKDRENNFVKVILKGEIEEGFSINEDLLLEKLKGDFYFLKIVDKTSIKLNLEELNNEFSVKGMYARKIYKKIEEATSDDEKETLMLALKLGLQSLSKEEVSLDDY